MNGTTTRTLRVLVVGAGVGGLTLAAALERRGVAATVVERTAELGRGYMLGLYPMASHVLRSLDGADQHLLGAAVPVDRFRLLDGTGGTVLDADVQAALTGFGPLLGVDRRTLLEVLATRWSGTVQRGRAVTGLEQRDGSVLVTFDHAAGEEFDVVVGADGIGSTVRTLAWPAREVSGVDTGWGGWVGFVEAAHDRTAAGFTEQWLPGSFAGVYPVRGALGVVVAGPSGHARGRGVAGAVDRHLARSAALEPVLSGLRHQTDIRWWPFRDVRTSTWARGRIVLVGDAATGFLPTAGIGASMAMDSAARLADELARTRPAWAPTALALFADHQRPRVEAVQRTSRRLARIMFLRSRAVSRARDRLTPMLPSAALTDPIVGPMRQWIA
ncbi:FAD-dependent oxidoreductase [Geodermatophilus sp. SYSU D00815]